MFEEVQKSFRKITRLQVKRRMEALRSYSFSVLRRNDAVERVLAEAA